MDEVQYKLNTNNSVLVVNAVDKLISTIKYKFKPAERSTFILHNEELKFLREQCLSRNTIISVTACQGLLALVELGVLEIAHTMSTVVTLLPNAHNYAAFISTIAGLLILDLKSRILPGQPYKCQFTFKNPQHPFITVLDKNKDVENIVLVQMQALCMHPDYIIASNSLELLYPVFLWLMCNPQREQYSTKPWQLLLSLPETSNKSRLLLTCITCQQICNPKYIEDAFAAHSVVADTAIYQQNREFLIAILPTLARISNELIEYGRDPRACYNLIDRCFSLDAPEFKIVSGITIMLLAENLNKSCALYLHELFNLCYNIISKYEHSALSLNVFVALSLQWLYQPAYLTNSALKVASKILDTHRTNRGSDVALCMTNLIANDIFKELVYTDSHLYTVYKLSHTWERIGDDQDKLDKWFQSLESLDDVMQSKYTHFLIGLLMDRRRESWLDDFLIRALRCLIKLIDHKKEICVQLLPILLYNIANTESPIIKLECIKAIPLMGKAKENVPTIVSILAKFKFNKNLPISLVIKLYTSLAVAQVRCFPYLQEILIDPGSGRSDDIKWEVDISRAQAINIISENPKTAIHGVELVPIISSILNRCTDRAGSISTCLVLQSLAHLWTAVAVAPPSTWRALEPKLGKDKRPNVQISICKLLSEIPKLRVTTQEYDKLLSDTAQKLWYFIAESNEPDVIEAACEALSAYKIDDYTLRNIPEIYRKCVRLPASYCKTPADAIRKPEDVLDYIPCEVWPEVFKYTNQTGLAGVQKLAKTLMEREIRSLRSGVYQPAVRGEPQNMTYLPATSVIRGLMECFRKQTTAPSYDFPDIVLLSILQSLNEEYSKPLPPMDLCFLHEVFHRGSQWKFACLKLAARQAQTTGSARRLLENYLQGASRETVDESEIMMIFELLPILCRGIPPNVIRPPVETFLYESFSAIANIKAKVDPKCPPQEYLFMKLLNIIKQCLQDDKIHDANRKLLSQIVENYFSIINYENVAWTTYIETCSCLSTDFLERMTSPSSWWEVSSELLRKSCSIRCAVAVFSAAECSTPLVWLNEVIDSHAAVVSEQDHSLRCMISALKAAKTGDPSTRDWFLQLMARTQIAFNEVDDESAKSYLCDVFMLSVIVFSGYWSLDPDYEDLLTSSRTAIHLLFPVSAAALLERPLWNDCTLQVLEWARHTRCARALRALRHSPHFAPRHLPPR